MARTAWISMGVPPSARSAFGVPGPSRTPRPAAGITAAVREGLGSAGVGDIDDIGCTPKLRQVCFHRRHGYGLGVPRP